MSTNMHRCCHMTCNGKPIAWFGKETSVFPTCDRHSETWDQMILDQGVKMRRLSPDEVVAAFVLVE